MVEAILEYIGSLFIEHMFLCNAMCMIQNELEVTSNYIHRLANGPSIISVIRFFI